MTAETIAKALGGRSAGARWMARCPAHEDRKPEPFDQLGQRWQGAGALPCRLRSGPCYRHSALARSMVGERSAPVEPLRASWRCHKPDRTAMTPEAKQSRACHLAVSNVGRQHAG